MARAPWLSVWCVSPLVKETPSIAVTPPCLLGFIWTLGIKEEAGTMFYGLEMEAKGRRIGEWAVTVTKHEAY